MYHGIISETSTRLPPLILDTVSISGCISCWEWRTDLDSLWLDQVRSGQRVSSSKCSGQLVHLQWGTVHALHATASTVGTLYCNTVGMQCALQTTVCPLHFELGKQLSRWLVALELLLGQQKVYICLLSKVSFNFVWYTKNNKIQKKGLYTCTVNQHDG